MNFLGGSGSTHEEHDAETLATPVHGEDRGHPRPNPFQVFRRLDDPNENDLSCRYRPIGVACYEVSNVRNAMSDTNPTGKKHDSAIRMPRYLISFCPQVLDCVSYIECMPPYGPSIKAFV